MSKYYDDKLNDTGEFLLDSIMESGVVKDIPIFNTMIGLYETGKRINDILFLRQLARFLKVFENLSSNERSKFAKRIDKLRDSKKLAENILLAVSLASDIDKPELIGLSLKALGDERINKDEMYQILHAIDKSSSVDLKYFFQSYSANESGIGNVVFSAVGLTNYNEVLTGAISSLTTVGRKFINEVYKYSSLCSD